MVSIQGEFATVHEATQAIDALKAAGAPPDHIRQWNILGPAVHATTGNSGKTAGAVIGGIAAGLPGLLAGAVLGGTLFPATVDTQLRGPIGVRVVVDITPTCLDPAAILLAHGATNVH